MTDDEKHEWCRQRGHPHAVFIPEALYRAAEKEGFDMRYYVIQKPIPIGPAGDLGQVGWLGGEYDR